MRVSVSTFLPLAFFFLLTVVHLGAMTSMPGAPRDVSGAENSLEVVEKAKFAVEEHNKKQNSDLKLLRVVSAKTQVVAGSLTRIRLQAADVSAQTVQEYEAAIWEKPWENFKDVTEFKSVPGSEPRSLTPEEQEAVKSGKPLTA